MSSEAEKGRGRKLRRARNIVRRYGRIKNIKYAEAAKNSKRYERAVALLAAQSIIDSLGE